MKILVIIVSYKDEENLRECIGGLKPFGFDVYVHDNSFRNLGFAGGVNAALRLASLAQGKLKYDWIWLLNPDCIVSVKGKLGEFKGIYGSDKGIGDVEYDIFSPVVYDTEGKIWFAGGKINVFTGECEHIKISNSKNSKERKGDRGWDTGWVSGCSMFIKPRVFENIGLFDEKFFLFYEDVDFCLRARQAGFRIGVVELDGLRMTHKVSPSVNKLSNKYEIEMKSKFYLLKKHRSYFYPTAHLISRIRYLKHKLVKGV